jgi:TolB-like protein
LSQFLRLVVEWHLEGREHEVKESVIGSLIFGRKTDYDPKSDAIVRTEARRLRALLNEYYLGIGKQDPLVIELPKGGYVPRFRNAETRAAPARLFAVWGWVGIGLVVALAFTAVALWVRFSSRSTPIPIAVLPLINLNEDSADDYLADGFTGELIRNLSAIDGLIVRSQTSSFTFKGKPRNVRDAGAQLGADYLVEGSVLRSGSQLRILAQLIRVRDDSALWSEKYECELSNIFGTQEEISRAIVNALRLKLGRGRRRYEANAAVYDKYLRARDLGIRLGRPGYVQSIPLLEEVVAKDPSFAPAHASLAQAHLILSDGFNSDIPSEVSKMRTAAERAVELDPLSGEALDALATAYARGAQWEQAERGFRHAIRVEPGRSESHSHFAMYYLLALGRLKEAIRELRLAEQNDPLSGEVQYFLFEALEGSGRYEDAARACDKMSVGFAAKNACVLRTRLRQGKIDEVIKAGEMIFQKGVEDGGVSLALGCAYVRAGRLPDAEKLANSSVNPFVQIRVYACLADKDRIFAALDRASSAGPIRIGWLLSNEKLAFLRGDPRLRELRNNVGLPN